MPNDISPPDLDVLARDDVSELFGWPVSLLDQILDVESLAGDRVIWIDEWRRRDAELRATGPKRFPRQQAEDVWQASLEAWLDSFSRGEEADGRMRRLAGRLGAALYGPPDATALRERLRRIDDHLAEERDRRLRAESQQHRDLVAQWLAAPGPLDDVTGLPWDLLARYRWRPDPVLGQVPTPLNAARQWALAEAPPETLRLARQFRPDGLDGLAAAGGDLEQLALTTFPRRIVETAERGTRQAKLAEQVLRLWHAPATRRFLLRETASGWPKHLRELDPPASVPEGTGPDPGRPGEGAGR